MTYASIICAATKIMILFDVRYEIIVQLFKSYQTNTIDNERKNELQQMEINKEALNSQRNER